ncbi:UBP-type zinc finger domain-containing protein [Spirillospora sp. NPDC047279]|uniref:UBP-type zinc finger domain-containing protein n=1 Tax=Spirillospora sp. NPDC047279 TaxID=3155478 RepID=UPI0033CFA04E
MISRQNQALDAGATSARGWAPPCEHLDGLVPVTLQSACCRGCQAGDDRRATLLTCLTCGWVACSDGSPNQHAKTHYEETGHPLAAPVAPGPRWRWCYAHQRLV